jgi:uncharacterized protein YidB (DUF937 family)
MGLLDDVMKSAAPAIAGQLAQNPQLLGAALSMLSTTDTSVGGSGGLGGLIGMFQQKGLGDMIASWVSTGPNPPVSPQQLHDVLGPDTLNQFAQKAGISPAEAGPSLAALLPSLIDALTPDGQVPETNALEGALGSLLGGAQGGGLGSLLGSLLGGQGR